MINLGVRGQHGWCAAGINDNGQIVGYEANGATTSATFGSPGSGIALSTLASALGGWTQTVASDIDNGGDIVGYGTKPNGQIDAFLLTPVPEPSTIILIAVAGAALSACAWRRRGLNKTIVAG